MMKGGHGQTNKLHIINYWGAFNHLSHAPHSLSPQLMTMCVYVNDGSDRYNTMLFGNVEELILVVLSFIASLKGKRSKNTVWSYRNRLR